VAGLTPPGIIAPFLLDGPINWNAFDQPCYQSLDHVFERLVSYSWSFCVQAAVRGAFTNSKDSARKLWPNRKLGWPGLRRSVRFRIVIMLTDAIRFVFFPALMVIAASSDLMTMTISNKLSLALAVGFFLLAMATGMSLAVVGMHLGAAAVVLIFAFGFFAQGWIGGGDVKLAAATALWFGFGYLLDYLLNAALFGGALTILLILFRQLHLPSVLARQSWILRLHKEGGGVPYGIALAAGALLVYPKTGWMPGG
jgi:prepilin peptidase CpaA